MTTTTSMILIIIGCAIVTWIPRAVPFMFVRSVKLPDVILRWLSFIPVCILSALVIENLFSEEIKLKQPWVLNHYRSLTDFRHLFSCLFHTEFRLSIIQCACAYAAPPMCLMVNIGCIR